MCIFGRISCCLFKDVMVFVYLFMSYLGKFLGKGEWGREKIEDVFKIDIKILNFFVICFYCLKLEYIVEYKEKNF